MDAAQIKMAFEDVYDQALLFHSFTPYMRDYDLFIHASADPRTGIPTDFLRYRFQNCVQANVGTRVSTATWASSLDERLSDYSTGVDLDGYVWGVNWQELYPSFLLLEPSAIANHWTSELGVPFYEALAEANAHQINLVFSDLTVTKIEPGHIPFSIGGHFDDGKIPL